MSDSHCRFSLSAAIAVVMGVALVVAGCGGGSEEAEPGAIETSAITKAEFIEQAEAICNRGNRWMLKQMLAAATEEEEGGSAGGDAFTAAAKSVALPRVQATIRDIAALGAPRGDEVQLEAFLTQMQQEKDALEEQPRISETELFNGGFSGSGELARDYGLRRCAYG